MLEIFEKSTLPESFKGLISNIAVSTWYFGLDTPYKYSTDLHLFLVDFCKICEGCKEGCEGAPRKQESI